MPPLASWEGAWPLAPLKSATEGRDRPAHFLVASAAYAFGLQSQSVDISRRPGPQQQTLPLWPMLGRTDGHTPVYTHPFNCPFSGTTQEGRYQNGKTNLDFTEARDSE